MTSDEYLENEYYREKLDDEAYERDRRHTERDPDIEMEEREERKRIAMEMDGPHEEMP